jgi:hypothetical protein
MLGASGGGVDVVHVVKCKRIATTTAGQHSTSPWLHHSTARYTHSTQHATPCRAHSTQHTARPEDTAQHTHRTQHTTARYTTTTLQDIKDSTGHDHATPHRPQQDTTTTLHRATMCTTGIAKKYHWQKGTKKHPPRRSVGGVEVILVVACQVAIRVVCHWHILRKVGINQPT